MRRSRPAQSNRLLNALPSSVRRRLLAQMESVALDLGEVLGEPDQPMPYVYFPDAGFISLLARLADGAQMEVAMVGREGMVGSSIVLGAKTSAQHAIVQGAGIAWRTAAELFSDYVEREPVLRKTLTTYIHVQMAQMAQTAACAHFHILQKRLATWLLMTQDRSRERSFLLTHEFMGYMLGVRRAGVTEALRYLEDRGLISYQRGRIEVLDMQGLKNSSCGCYVVERKILESTLGK